MYPKTYVVLTLLAKKCIDNMQWTSCAPPTGSINFQVMSPFVKNDAVSNYLEGMLVLFVHFLFLNYVGILVIILRTPWPYATDAQGSPDPTLLSEDSLPLFLAKVPWPMLSSLLMKYF